MSDAPAWRQATDHDLDAIVSVQDRVHTLASESHAVFAAKLRAYPHGCLVYDWRGETLGYGVYHPWRLGGVPVLHMLPFVLPGRPDCLFVHDVALLPPARGRGAARTLVATVAETAETLGLDRIALVSVYDTAPIWSRLGFAVCPLAFSAETRAQYGDAARYMVSTPGTRTPVDPT